MILNTVLGILFCVLSGLWLIIANVIPLWGQWILALLLWALWLGSGCLAATAAELLNRRVLPHALLGLCFPYIYPCLLICCSRRFAEHAEEVRQQEEVKQQEEQKQGLADRFHAMQEKREQERMERIAAQQNITVEDVAAREAERQAEAAAAAVPEPEEEAEPVPETDHEIYQILYSQPVDPDGVRQGPFQFTLTSGDTIDIAGVRELLPDIMVCTVYDTGKSVRIRYTQVESIARYETE